MEQKLEILSVYADNLIDRFIKQVHVDTFVQDYYAILKSHKEQHFGKRLFLNKNVIIDFILDCEIADIQRTKLELMIDKINLAILIYYIHNNLDYERCLSYFFINVVGPSRAYSRKTIEFFFSLKLNIFRNKINAVPEDQVKELAEDFFGNTISSMLPSSNPGNAKVIKKNSKILEMFRGFTPQQIVQQNFGAPSELNEFLKAFVSDRYLTLLASAQGNETIAKKNLDTPSPRSKRDLPDSTGDSTVTLKKKTINYPQFK